MENLPIHALLIGADYSAVPDIFREMFDVRAFGVYTVSFVAAYRIAVNPMARDELDYLLEAKGVDNADSRYGKGYLRRNQRLSNQVKRKKTGLNDII